MKRDGGVAGGVERKEEFWEFWEEVKGRKEWEGRCKRVGLDGRCEDPV